jgi:transposase
LSIVALSLPLVCGADSPTTTPAATGSGLPSLPRCAIPPWDRQTPRWQEIDQRLAPEHLARRIDRAVDQLDLRELFASYGGTGSLPYPPDLLLKVVLYETHRGRPSPADWARDIRESEPLRWLAFGCEPSRARCYAFRDRLEKALPTWQHQLVQQAMAVGLTDGHRAALDGTAIAANASRHRLANADTLQQRLQQLEQARAADESLSAVAVPPAGTTAEPAPANGGNGSPAAVSPPPRWLASTKRGRRQQQRRYRRAQEFLNERLRRNAQRRREDRRPPDQVVISLSDPEAALGQDKLRVYRPLYNVQVLIDLDSPLILAYEVFAQPTDDGTLGPMLQRARAALTRLPRDWLMDAKYAAGTQLALAEEAGVVVYAPWQEKEPGQRARRGRPQIPKEEFPWHAALGTYECPQGHLLDYQGRQVERRSGQERVRLKYRCAAEHCCACPRQPDCTQNPQAGRLVTRHQHEEQIEALRTRMQTPAARALYRLRKQTVERGLADIKEHRGLRRFSGRGLKRTRIQLGLTVVAHNLPTLEQARTTKAEPAESEERIA